MREFVSAQLLPYPSLQAFYRFALMHLLCRVWLVSDFFFLSSKFLTKAEAAGLITIEVCPIDIFVYVKTNCCP